MRKEILLKIDDSVSTKSSNSNTSIAEAKNQIQIICKTLCINTDDYKPQLTVQQISAYITSSSVKRIMYSGISHYVFSLESERKGTCITNAEKLLEYVYNPENKVDEKCKNAVIKIYDHCNLAVAQTERFVEVFKQGIEETKADFSEDLSKIQKEYITILGIFASVILAFIGGVTFSTSVFENIHKASPYRIVFISALLGFTVVNAIAILLRFLLRINGKNNTDKKSSIPVLPLNILFIAVMIITGLLWLHERYNILSFIL